MDAGLVTSLGVFIGQRLWAMVMLQLVCIDRVIAQFIMSGHFIAAMTVAVLISTPF